MRNFPFSPKLFKVYLSSVKISKQSIKSETTCPNLCALNYTTFEALFKSIIALELEKLIHKRVAHS